MDLNKVDQQMKDWLVELGEYIQSSSDYQIDEKADFRDLVSEVDVAVEEKLTKYIRSLPGEQTILGEEGDNENIDVNADRLWVIDPIDGTSNFIKQADDYGILAAYFEKGEPLLSYIYEVPTKTLVSAQKGKGVYVNGEKITTPENLKLNEAMISINPRKMNRTELLDQVAEEAFDLRFLGSSVSDSIRVIDGKYGAFLSTESEPWDRAPHILIAKELGLHMSQFNGDDTTLVGNESFIFSTKAIYEELFN